MGTTRRVKDAGGDVSRLRELEAKIDTLTRANDDLAEREILLKQILDTSSVAIFLVDMEGRITQANQRMAEMFGCPIDDLIGSEYVSLVHPAEREIGRQRMLALLGSAIPAVDLERLYWRADHREFWGHLTDRRFYDAKGEERGLVGVIADITVRKQAEDQLKESEHKLSEILENVEAYIYLKDVRGRYLFANRLVRELFGASMEEVIGQGDEKFFDAKTVAQLRDNDRLVVEKGETLKAEETNRNLKDGRTSTYLSVKLPLRNEAGEIYALCGISTDITMRKQMEDQIRQLAFYDMLTTLPNRRLLSDRLSQLMAASKRSARYSALLFLDLDNFKPLNDTHGHAVGDLLLIEAADRLKGCVREMDTVARFGGDEFVAAISELDVDKAESAAQAGAIAEKIRIALGKPYVLKVPHDGAEMAVEHQCTASIGVVLFLNHEASEDDILKWADLSMYQAKEAGRNAVRFYGDCERLAGATPRR